MSVPFIPVTPKQAARNIARKMGFVRQDLMAKGEYLANPTITERVAWEPHGSGHRLVVLPHPSPSSRTREETPYPDNPAAASPNPFDIASSPSNNDPNASPKPADDTPTDPLVDDVPADPPAPAILAIVTQLVPGQSCISKQGVCLFCLCDLFDLIRSYFQKSSAIWTLPK